MRVTEAGKELLLHVNELIRIMENIRGIGKENELSGQLNVLCGDTLLEYRLPEVLLRFKTMAPKVRLSIRTMNCCRIRDALLEGNADIGVLYQVENTSSLVQKILGEFPLALVGSPLLVEDFSFSEPDQNIPITIITKEPNCIFRNIFEKYLIKNNITVTETLELWSTESIKKCVAENVGISLLPHFAVERELRAGILKAIPFPGDEQKVTAICAHHANKWISPAMRLFMNLVVKSEKTSATWTDKKIPRDL